MQFRPTKKITHTLTLDEVKLNLYQFVLAVVRVLEEELPIEIHESILARLTQVFHSKHPKRHSAFAECLSKHSE